MACGASTLSHLYNQLQTKYNIDMSKFLIVDSQNLFFRARHVTRGTLEEKTGLALDIILSSISKCWRDFKPDHVVFCLDSRSWRKDFYQPYKANRVVDRSTQSVKDAEEHAAFRETFNDFLKYLNERTNCTVLQNSVLEADDLVAGFIQSLPDDEHIIISSDTDFVQLLNTNVSQYNGISKELLTINGVYDIKGNLVIDKKTKEPKVVPDPEWLLFSKCVKGDPTDNVFSAYPGVRVKSSKKKIGLLEAYADRNRKGYAYNNFMLQKWLHHDGTEHRVMDDYQRNVTLVDLSAQPAHIRDEITKTILENQITKSNPQVGSHFLKFCGKHDLITLSQNAQLFATILSSPYPCSNITEISA